MSDLRDQVRDRYAAAATAVAGGTSACCAESAESAADALCCASEGVAVDEGFGAEPYSPDERAELPPEAVLASLGCGNPLAVADLQAGEVVLDLGSGGGIDVLLSARRVGPEGKAYGLDMTEEMLALARTNAAKAGATNVEFLRGHIEEIPLPAGSVDVVISNCVLNLSTDKPAVLAEMFRVLRPRGRIGISDVVADDALTSADRAARGSYVGCIAGALSFTEYTAGLHEVGFTDVSLTPTHQAADGMHAAIIRAPKPTAASAGTQQKETGRPSCPRPSGRRWPATLRCRPRAGPSPAGRGGADGSSHRSGIGPPGRSARRSRLCAATPGTGSTSSGPAPATGAFPWPSPAAPD